jgi:hypothetical protein
MLNFLAACFVYRRFLTFKIAKLLWDFRELSFLSGKGQYCSINYGFFRGYYIVVGLDMSNLKCNTGLLHEIGHYIDFKKRGIKTDSKTETRRAEILAWKYAIELSKQYDIPICPATARKWLNTYKTDTVHLIKLLPKDEQRVILKAGNFKRKYRGKNR